MESRQDYFKNYYQNNKKKLIAQVKKDYKRRRKDHLTYQQKYYKDNREEILATKKTKSLAFRGHAYSIWSAIHKYAKLWKLPCCSFTEFYEGWTYDDPTYQQLYDTWVESDYNEYLSPVVMRSVKKNGYLVDNLKWDIKKNYSWWNEDSAIFKEVTTKLDNQQRDRKKQISKEWRKKVYQDFKAKQKAKRVS